MHLRKAARDNETMPPIAKALTPDERQAIAKFYAGLVAPKMEEPQKADDKTIAAGAALGRPGRLVEGVAGLWPMPRRCRAGRRKDVPCLAGQSAEYIMSQLKAWKDGKRTNDPLHLMTGISSKLSDDQIAAVAAYYASLPVAAAASASRKDQSHERASIRSANMDSRRCVLGLVYSLVPHCPNPSASLS